MRRACAPAQLTTKPSGASGANAALSAPACARCAARCLFWLSAHVVALTNETPMTTKMIQIHEPTLQSLPRLHFHGALGGAMGGGTT